MKIIIIGYDLKRKTMGQDRNSETDLIENTNTICFQDKKQKKHECTYPDCKAVFYRPSRLARHVRSHTGEVMIALHIFIIGEITNKFFIFCFFLFFRNAINVIIQTVIKLIQILPT